jgi:predicted MPP superfamily phosphohydrolase
MSVLSLALGAAAAAGCWAAAVEPRLLRLRQPCVRATAWPADRPPLRLGILSDLHAAWPHMTVARIGRIAARLAEARPDVILLPGDFVSTHTRFVRRIPIEPAAEALAPLAAAAPTFAVLGNHDWHYGGERVAKALERHGIGVLRNAATLAATRDGPVWIAGLDCMWSGRADLARTLQGLDGKAPAVLMSHLPDVFPDVPPGIPLTVAGHTHGGQVCLPGYGPLRTLTALPRRQACGLHESEGRHLYVTAGVGTTCLPIRFWRPPEIALLTLGGLPPA